MSALNSSTIKSATPYFYLLYFSRYSSFYELKKVFFDVLTFGRFFKQQNLKPYQKKYYYQYKNIIEIRLPKTVCQLVK